MLLLVAAALASPAESAAATKLGPCTIGDPSSCTFHPRPNMTVFCGRERSHYAYSTHDFRGCRVEGGNTEVECGLVTNTGYFGVEYQLTGCIVTFGVNRVMVGCQSQWIYDTNPTTKKTCGVAPLAACQTETTSAFLGDRTTTTCGREPVVVHCLDDENWTSPVHYCELVIGPAASPVFSCRFNNQDPEAALADVAACLTGLGARRRQS